MSVLTSRLHQNLTARFVRENRVSVKIERRFKIADGKGGFTWSAPYLLPPQYVRKIAATRVGATTQRTTADGRVVVATATIVTQQDADVQRWDRFLLNEVWHEVLDVRRPLNGLHAEVVEETG